MTNKITLSPSHIPTIMGDNAERKADLFLIKTGLMLRPKPTEAMLWGRKLEPLVLEHIKETHPEHREFSPIDREDWNNQYRIKHPEHDWFYGFSDDIVKTGEQFKTILTIVEVKTTARYIGLSADNIPDAWRLQCQAMLAMVPDAAPAVPPANCLLSCLSAGNRYSEIIIDPDPDCQQAIVEAAAAFRQAIANNDMGQFKLTSRQLNYAHRATPDKTVKTTIDIDTTIDDYKKLNNKIKDHNEHKEMLARTIKTHMQDAEVLLSETGDTLATWKSYRSGTRTLKIK